MDCFLTNTTSGNIITVGVTGATTSASPGNVVITFTTATESFTCPAASTREDIFPTNNDVKTQLCYVITASSHASFEVKVTVSGTGPIIHSMIVEEWVGPTTFDSGSASAAAASTVSVTTANTNEVVIGHCSDVLTTVTTGSGFSQVTKANGSIEAGPNWRGFKEYQVFSGTGAHTTNCPSTGSSGLPQIVAFAFQQSAPAVPVPTIIQSCGFTLNTFGTTGNATCSLSNVVSGNKVIVAATMRGPTTFSPTISSGCDETCTFLSGTFQHTSYSGNDYSTVIGYVDLASSHAAFTAGIGFSGCPGCVAVEMFAIEVSGLLSGVDSGSASACAAITCNYTTVSPNEFTVSIAGDSPTTVMTPGNSFLQYGYMQKSSGGEVIFGGLLSSKTTVSSGSNTASYTVTGSTAPLLAVLAFGEVPSGSRVKSKIL